MSAAEPSPSNATVSGIVVELRPGVTFSVREAQGRRSYVCHDAERGRYFHFGPAEYEVAKRLDGSQGLGEVLKTLPSVGVYWTAAELGQFTEALVKHQLASLRSTSAEVAGAGAPRATDAGRPHLSLRLLAGLLSQRIPLFQANALASRLTERFGFMFRGRGVLLWLAVVLSAAFLVLGERAAFGHQLKHLLSPQTWPWLILAFCLLKVCHEAGHAVAAKRQGVRVGQAGLLLFMLAPLAYVNVTDAWRLPRRWARVQIGLAGVYLELFFAGCAVWIWHFAESETIRHVAAQVAILAGPATLLVNANPLLRLDGYYVLSDLLQIPNLRMHGRQQLAGWFEHLLLGRPLRASLLDPWRTRFATIHAACSIVFQIVWMTGLAVAVSVWAEGLGIFIAAAAVLFWLVIPLLRWSVSIWHAEDWPRFRLRLGVAAGLLLCIVGVLGWIPSPWARRVPVVIQYQDAQISRASTDGFITAVHVRSGQQVAPGDLLVEMEAPELTLQRDALRVDEKASRLRARQLSRQNKLAMAAAELERHASLRRQKTELDRQVNALQLRAERAGIVSSYAVERWTGKYVRQGEVLLRIGDEANKEILASIGGGDLDAYLLAACQGAVRPVRLRGGFDLSVPLQIPRPRVSVNIPHPALSSRAGGPLPVQTSDEAEGDDHNTTQLVAPRSHSICGLDPETSRRVRVGQQGMMMIGDTRSVWNRLGDFFRRMLDAER